MKNKYLPVRRNLDSCSQFLHDFYLFVNGDLSGDRIVDLFDHRDDCPQCQEIFRTLPDLVECIDQQRNVVSECDSQPQVDVEQQYGCCRIKFLNVDRVRENISKEDSVCAEVDSSRFETLWLGEREVVESCNYSLPLSNVEGGSADHRAGRRMGVLSLQSEVSSLMERFSTSRLELGPPKPSSLERLKSLNFIWTKKPTGAQLSQRNQKAFKKLLKKAGIRLEGHVKFLEGCRSGPHMEFGHLVGNQFELEILDFVTTGFLQPLMECSPDLIIGHTQAGHLVAEDLAKNLGMHADCAIAAYGAYPPIIPVIAERLRGKRIAIVVDATMSGSLMGKIVDLVRDGFQAEVVFVGALVNTGYFWKQDSKELNLHYLCSEEVDSYELNCKKCKKGDLPRIYEHSLGISVPGKSIQDFDKDWELHVSEYRRWWDWISQTHALKTNYRVDENVHEIFIDSRAMLDHKEVRGHLEREISENLTAICKMEPGVVVYKGSSNARAQQVADVIAELFGWESLSIQYSKGLFTMNEETVALIKGRPVLLADAAINSGSTLLAMVDLIKNASPKSVDVFCIVNRLWRSIKENRFKESLKKKCEGRFFYLLPFPFQGLKLPAEKCRAMAEIVENFEKSSPVESEQKRIEILSRVRKGASIGSPEYAFRGALNKEVLSNLVKMVPAEFGKIDQTRQSLVCLLRTEVPLPVKASIVDYFVRARSFDWLRDGWLLRNSNALQTPIGDCFVQFTSEGMKADRELCENLLGQIGQLIIEEKNHPQAQGELGVSEPKLPEGCYLERLRRLEAFGQSALTSGS